MSLAVVGVAYPNRKGGSRQFEIAVCEPGEPVELRPEPTNPADHYAVAVYSCRGIQMGYITAERAPWISRQLAEGREIRVIFQNSFPRGAWIRAAFDGFDPILPPMAPPLFISTRDSDAVDVESSFEPDFIPPDD
jgi:hypothetical protein